MHRWVAALLLLCGCDLVLLGDEHSFGFRRTITISPSSTMQLLDFPISVVTNADAGLRAHARPDGGDISFTDPAGTPLPFERVAYADGSLEAWVRVTLQGQTQLVMHYGGEVAPFVREQVWADDVMAAYHLAEPSGRVEDSTSNGYHLQPELGNDPATTAGMIGAGRAFRDLLNDPDRLCAPPGDVLRIGSSSFSLSLWMKAPLLLSGFDMPIYAGGEMPSSPGVDFEISTTGWTVNLTDGTLGERIDVLNPPTKRWAHVAFSVRRATNAGVSFVDGQRNSTSTFDPGLGAISAMPLCLGGPSGYGGELDEVRIYSSPKAEDWFDAEFDNVMARDTFIVIGDEE